MTFFSRRFNLFVEQTLLSHRTDTNFPRNPYFSPRTHTNFPGAFIFSSNRYSFSRKPYLVLEHLRFSRRPLCLEHIGIFQEGTPSRTDISLLGLGGCFRSFNLNCRIVQLIINQKKNLFITNLFIEMNSSQMKSVKTATKMKMTP